jgi:hypothetical protein
MKHKNYDTDQILLHFAYALGCTSIIVTVFMIFWAILQ